MYLEHFGIAEHPFRITPVTVFFFSGANRGEILDALIYSICEIEGIVKVSGEVGSGKTMLCRMLLEKLPGHIETIYLANPSLSREEMLYAIADGLGLSTAGDRVGIIMSMIQNKLEEKARKGKRIVVLVDEAHAMPLDTLEELRLLYNLQVGNSKLLQIVLFGQPELNTKLNQPNMRQLKDRIVHHFHMQPLSRNILESYLMFRMRTAGYHGPNIFSPGAVRLIANASNGLMRRVNILADKSLMSAFIEDTYYIKTHHVQAALRDSDLKPFRSRASKGLVLAGAAAAVLLAGLTAWWMMGQKTEDITSDLADASGQPSRMASSSTRGQSTENSASPAPPLTAEESLHRSGEPTGVPLAGARGGQEGLGGLEGVNSEPKPVLSRVPEAGNPPSGKPDVELTFEVPAAGNAPLTAPPASTAVATTEQAVTFVAVPAFSDPTLKHDKAATGVAMTTTPAPPANSNPAAKKFILFEQRLAAGKQLLEQKAAAASIQLFYNEEINPERIEGFLRRADRLGKLPDIYLLPTKFGSKNGLRVLYGAYPSINAARKATRKLPTRYREAFATSIYIW